METPVRFLDTATYALTRNDDRDFKGRFADDSRYAILSHRWQDEEITYDSLDSNRIRQGTDLTAEEMKLRKACDQARRESPPIKWLWADNCCINKSSTVEESRSLNSMFRWYSNAQVCFAYLYDVDSSVPSFRPFKKVDKNGRLTAEESEWFYRGWTLQELLAPRNMKFYDRNWRFFGMKKDLENDLHRITGIAINYLNHKEDFLDASVATRMSWMAGRHTRDVEDIAYSMLGIFDISMEPRYGEGTKAFMRLQTSLMENSKDESLFAWTWPDGKRLACFSKGVGKPPVYTPPSWSPSSWGLLAPSPDCFKASRDVVITGKIYARLDGGYRWTQQGVQFMMPFKAGTEISNLLGLPRKKVDFPLNCWKYEGSTLKTVVLHLAKTSNGYVRDEFEVLKLEKGAKPSTNQSFGIDQGLTKPLTITQEEFRLK